MSVTSAVQVSSSAAAARLAGGASASAAIHKVFLVLLPAAVRRHFGNGARRAFRFAASFTCDALLDRVEVGVEFGSRIVIAPLRVEHAANDVDGFGESMQRRFFLGEAGRQARRKEVGKQLEQRVGTRSDASFLFPRRWNHFVLIALVSANTGFPTTG